MTPTLGPGALSDDACLTSVWHVHLEYSWCPQLLEARCAGCRRCKVCMGWSWATVCGVQGRGHIVWPRAQLVFVVVLVALVEVR